MLFKLTHNLHLSNSVLVKFSFTVFLVHIPTKHVLNPETLYLIILGLLLFPSTQVTWPKIFLLFVLQNVHTRKGALGFMTLRNCSVNNTSYSGNLGAAPSD